MVVKATKTVDLRNADFALFLFLILRFEKRLIFKPLQGKLQGKKGRPFSDATLFGNLWFHYTGKEARRQWTYLYVVQQSIFFS